MIFEAMAVGVPVIIPPSYEPLFKEAAIYAKPEEVQAKVKQLMEDKSLYQKQVDLALTYVDEQFGYRQHSERLFRS
ncbi:glycosyltransferase [Bacillus sp. JCM 19034]|uniref:glycosyltransferase n=1 Tax=Bacillus sp. JCM 19034 TaxID=1481928 RepID=UPI000A7F2C1E|nr:glycosyltransferase [Bacillus sp. JCM 19034]